jgi:hypothetical protein
MAAGTSLGIVVQHNRDRNVALGETANPSTDVLP